MSELTLNDLIMPADSNQLSYTRGQMKKDNNNVPWGQRKLAIALLEFLTLYYDPNEHKDAQLIYAGSAPGVGISLITQLFPTMTFHMYDERLTYSVGSNVKVYGSRNDKGWFTGKLFTDKEVEYWAEQAKHKPVFLVSDIRSLEHGGEESEEESTSLVLDNINLQMSWHQAIKPIKSQLKFRFPYYNVGTQRKYKYLNGVVYYGIWARLRSTETRLVVDRDEDVVEWDSKIYEDQMNHFNINVRSEKEFGNAHLDLPEFDQYFDSQAELYLWNRYLERFATRHNDEDVIALAYALTDRINTNLSKGIHHRYSDVNTITSQRLLKQY